MFTVTSAAKNSRHRMFTVCFSGLVLQGSHFVEHLMPQSSKARLFTVLCATSVKHNEAPHLAVFLHSFGRRVSPMLAVHCIECPACFELFCAGISSDPRLHTSHFYITLRAPMLQACISTFHGAPQNSKAHIFTVPGLQILIRDPSPPRLF